MGFLDQKERVFDIALTDKGRELLSKNQLNFVYYAFSDEGIDYSGSLKALDPSLSPNAILVQSVTSGSSGAGVTTFTASLASAPQSGNMLIALVGNQGGNQLVTSVTQNNVTWTKILSGSDIGSNGTSTSLWYASNIGAGAGTAVGFGMNGGVQTVVQLAEFAGVIALDQTASNFLDQTYATGSTGITPLTTNQYELIIAGMTSIANNFHSMSSAGYALVGAQTGSGIINTSMFYKLVNKVGTQEAIISFASPFNPLDFTTAPTGLPVGSIATFRVTTSGTLPNYDIDGYIHKNLAFEANSRKNKTEDMTSFLYTIPERTKVLPEFKLNVDVSASISLERRFVINSIILQNRSHTVIDKPLDIVVRATVPKKTLSDRVKEYVDAQKFKSIFTLLSKK